ncbi:cold-shock protein [Chloroflexota bacterium]
MIHSQFDEEMIVNEPESETQNYVGQIESYNTNRGFGFLKDESGERVFFHISEVTNPGDIALGRQVEFEKAESEKGLKAIRMTVVLIG